MRARVIDRQSGEAVDEIEADSVYGLFQALLDWAERRGVPRFQAPLLYRTDRSAAPPVPVGPDDASAEALPLPLFDQIAAEPAAAEPRPKRSRRPLKRAADDGTGPVAEQPRLF